MKVHFLLAALLAGCATADRVSELEAKVDRLTETMDKFEKGAIPNSKSKSDDGGGDSKEETAAREMFTEINGMMKEGKMDAAKAKITEMEKKYSETKTWRRARKVAAELEVIGKDAPKEFVADKWLIGNKGDVDFSSDKPTLVIFWEIWCPHCKREVPQLQATFDEYNSKGLQMVGLTKMTRSATEDSVGAFLKEKNVKYPIAKENGDISKAFNVSGIPAAAVVKSGKIVWRGHPARLSNEMIEGWL